jgi:hypothetical protein
LQDRSIHRQGLKLPEPDSKQIFLYKENQVHTKGAFTHPVSTGVFRIALQFLLLTLIEQNQGK